MTLVPFIRFNDLKIRNIISPRDKLCSMPKIQNILVFISYLLVLKTGPLAG
jgi:hypothetical protein